MQDEPLGPLSKTQTLDLLQKLAASPNKNLGQNFLIDKNIVLKSVQLSGIAVGDNVVEIGPGLGTLTRELLRNQANVFAIEFDSTFFKFLRDEFASMPNFNIQLGDAVRHPFAGFHQTSQRFKVVSNLPYNISTPWFDSVLDQKNLPDSMTLMLQKETAQRLTASHGSKAFAAISIFLASAYQLEHSFNVPGSCFFPSPKVDSSIVHFVLKKDPIQFSTTTKRFIRQIFSQRRKQIGTTIKHFHPKALEPVAQILSQFGFDLKARPEQLPLNFWQALDKLNIAEPSTLAQG